MGCDVDCICGLDPILLWLLHRPPAAAPIQTLAIQTQHMEPPYAAGMALKKKNSPVFRAIFIFNFYFGAYTLPLLSCLIIHC